MAISSVATKKNSTQQDGLATVLSPQRRAERTPGEVAVSAITRECRGEVKTLPGIAQTNSELLPMGRGFSIVGAVG